MSNCIICGKENPPQLLSKTDNKKKSNKFIPQDEDILVIIKE